MDICLDIPFNKFQSVVTFSRNFSTDTSVVCWDQVGLVRLGILRLELGEKNTFWHWEWGRILA